VQKSGQINKKIIFYPYFPLNNTYYYSPDELQADRRQEFFG